MTKARIYQPAKNAMQSGTAKTKFWWLEVLSPEKMPTDPLMGWTGMPDTLREIKLKFATKDEAIAYAVANKIAYEVFEPKPRKQEKKAYADNFSFKRIKAF